jgi:tetratricopeptide (TPR) repeat protein
MIFHRKVFSKKEQGSEASSAGEKLSKVDPANDPNIIKVFDGYGREMFITKQQWKDNVLLGNLEKEWNNSDQLYGMLVRALQDGFAADVIPYAERILNDFLSAHGEDGVVLTNLAKVHSRRGDDARAESILWHALEVDPNQDNGLDWYVAIHRDRGGESSALDAYRRVAAIPRSWRAQLWLARDALQSKDLAAAQTLYTEALARAERPVPPDLLMQMIGDLGNNGYLAEIIRLVEPCFDPAFHGLRVGNNLINANYDLGRMEAARSILNQLYAQKRHDWQQTLGYWDTELAKAHIAQRAEAVAEQLSASLMSIEGPLWTHGGSPFAALLPAKRANARGIAVFGSTALLAKAPDKPAAQLSDAPGRLSRSIPLILAERIHLTTDAAGFALIPWVQNEGFALLGRPYKDQDLCDLASKGGKAPDFVVGVTVDATQSRWKLLLRLVRRNDGLCIAEAKVEAASEDPGPAVERLAEKMVRLLTQHAGIRTISAPTWYQIPTGQDSSVYLLRLEQQLAVTCMHLDFLEGGGLYGEHEILDGILQLCVRQPTNQIVRMIFAQTLRQMQKVRPEILSEYKEKIDLLQCDHPLPGDIGHLIEGTIARALEGEASTTKGM